MEFKTDYDYRCFIVMVIFDAIENVLHCLELITSWIEAWNGIEFTKFVTF